MFGIGGGELIFVILMVLMLFGSDKIPDIARTMGKMMRQLKHATEDIKNEVQQSAKNNGLDANTLTGGISDEIKKAKESISKTINPMDSITSELSSPIEKVKEDIENLSGPIKRQL